MIDLFADAFTNEFLNNPAEMQRISQFVRQELRKTDPAAELRYELMIHSQMRLLTTEVKEHVREPASALIVAGGIPEKKSEDPAPTPVIKEKEEPQRQPLLRAEPQRESKNSSAS